MSTLTTSCALLPDKGEKIDRNAFLKPFNGTSIRCKESDSFRGGDYVFDSVYTSRAEYATSYKGNVLPLVEQALVGKSVGLVFASTPKLSIAEFLSIAVYKQKGYLMNIASQMLGAVDAANKAAPTAPTKDTYLKGALLSISWFTIACDKFEKITDVLRAASDSTTNPSRTNAGVPADNNFVLRELGKGRGMTVPGLWEVEISNASDPEEIVAHVLKMLPAMDDPNVHTVFQLKVTTASAALAKQAKRATDYKSVLHNDPPGVGRVSLIMLSKLSAHQDVEMLSTRSYYPWVDWVERTVEWVQSGRASPPFHKCRLMLLMRDIMCGRMSCAAIVAIKPPCSLAALQPAVATEESIAQCKMDDDTCLSLVHQWMHIISSIAAICDPNEIHSNSNILQQRHQQMMQSPSKATVFAKLAENKSLKSTKRVPSGTAADATGESVVSRETTEQRTTKVPSPSAGHSQIYPFSSKDTGLPETPRQVPSSAFTDNNMMDDIGLSSPPSITTSPALSVEEGLTDSDRILHHDLLQNSKTYHNTSSRPLTGVLQKASMDKALTKKLKKPSMLVDTANTPFSPPPPPPSDKHSASVRLVDNAAAAAAERASVIAKLVSSQTKVLPQTVVPVTPSVAANTPIRRKLADTAAADQESFEVLSNALQASRDEVAKLKSKIAMAEDLCAGNTSEYESLLNSFRQQGSMLNQKDKGNYLRTMGDLQDYAVYKEVVEAAMVRMRAEADALIVENKAIRQLNKKNLSMMRSRLNESQADSNHYNHPIAAVRSGLSTQVPENDKYKQVQREVSKSNKAKSAAVAAATAAKQELQDVFAHFVKPSSSEEKAPAGTSVAEGMLGVEEHIQRLVAMDKKHKEILAQTEELKEKISEDALVYKEAHGKSLAMIMSLQEENEQLRLSMSFSKESGGTKAHVEI